MCAPISALRGLVLVMMVMVTSNVFRDAHGYELRTFNGTKNNIDNPDWGSVGSVQLRQVAGADYADESFTPPGDDRPTAREVMTEVFLSTPGNGSTFSALFVAWAQLIVIDIALIVDNSSEAFDVPCDDGGGMVDVWCPFGVDSDPIPFYRSAAALGDDIGGAPVRCPINYATAYIDLDFMYGRTEEEALSLRTLDGGLMNITEDGLPHLNEDATWKIPDQRTAIYPVTFALHVMLLREHNRCCEEEGPMLGFSGDEDLYFACRRWTIAITQHITEEDFVIRLLGGNIFTLGRAQIDLWEASSNSTDDSVTSEGLLGHKRAQRSRALEVLEVSCYDSTTNAGVDVLAITAGGAAFESAIPPAMRVLDEGYVPMDDDMVDLHEASKDLANFVRRNGIGPILRGATLSTSMSADAHYSAVVSNLSPLFKLPVDAVQRGRDHGLPTYNDAREAYGLTPATSFADVTGAIEVQMILEDAYGGDIDLLDAYTGALAESSGDTYTGFLGDLLQAVWVDQLYRTITGDRLYHNHSEEIEDVALAVLSGVINRTAGVTDLPLSVFDVPDISVCSGTCYVTESEVELSDGFTLSWEAKNENVLTITLGSKSIGDQGMLAIGFGGDTMTSAQDFIICEVFQDGGADCVDRQPVESQQTPSPDFDNYTASLLPNVRVTVEESWTEVCFDRDLLDIDSQDYDLASDINSLISTEIIYAFRAGEGIDQHPNANRGSATVNFATGDSEIDETSDEFYQLHGALILVAWMVLLPIGIYFARYRKGETVIFGNEWYEMHAECMIVASEAVLPMAITAIVATGEPHTSSHAKWGFYMIASLVVQIVTGWLRVKALGAKQSNFCLLHRINKYFHIWAGRVAYVLGLVQCYRGVCLMSERDSLIFSTLEMSFEFGTFGTVYHIFPVWLAVLAVALVFLEIRKHLRSFAFKGATKVCGWVEFVNEKFVPGGGRKRLMPRTEDLPIYTTEEFNEKVLNGQSWAMVDGAIVDVGDFSHRHPGGSRLITNAVGTDITYELLGEDQSIGHMLSFTPHRHTQKSWKIVRGLVVGYIHEDSNAPDGSTEEDSDKNIGSREEEEVGDSSTGTSLSAFTTKRHGSIKLATVKLPFSTRVNFTAADPMAWRTRRSISIAALPELPVMEPRVDETASNAPNNYQVSTVDILPSDGPARSLHPRVEGCDIKSRLETSGSNMTAIMERFHVCPLLLRELMGKKESKRPVYRYVFACPGAASVLAHSMKGACFFNLRATRGQERLVESTSKLIRSRVREKVVSTADIAEGELCIEMRIRHYEDGAMSKLLASLAEDPDNPVVQLQGPFLIDKVIPPPAHRNVVMIAGGTGINPMVQIIRNYHALARAGEVSHKARLVVVWQVTSEADLYCADELSELQMKARGLLEVTVVISGDHRPRNIPAVAFRRAKARLKDAISSSSIVSHFNSPSQVSSCSQGRTISSFLSQTKQTPRSYDGNSDDVGGPGSHASIDKDTDEGTNESMTIGQKALAILEEDMQSDDVSDCSKEAKAVEEEGCIPPTPNQEGTPSLMSEVQDDRPSLDSSLSKLPKVLKGLTRVISFGIISKRNMPSANLVEESMPRRPLCGIPKNSMSMADGEKMHGKVDIKMLTYAFDEPLMELLSAYSNSTDSEQLQDEAPGVLRDKADSMEKLCGTETEPGKLQVIVSGPRGFVFRVENILEDMKVPKRAIVMLD